MGVRRGTLEVLWFGCALVVPKLTIFISIREFCEPQIPILMFDKNGDFIVMRLEQVGRVT